jgi:hypothetical protein
MHSSTYPLCDHIMDILPTLWTVVMSDNNISSIYVREHSRVIFVEQLLFSNQIIRWLFCLHSVDFWILWPDDSTYQSKNIWQ